jgi:nucleoside-diphosphate-sugar epimerase
MHTRQVFVTGGSGFIGGAVVKSLATDYRIRAMARSAAAAAAVEERGGAPILCSLEDVASINLEGCEIVVHCAAEVSEWAAPGLFHRSNVFGTMRLLEAARNAGVRKFVHISTDSVLFTGVDLRGVDETRPIPSRSSFEYGATKAAGEKAVVSANDPTGLETVALRPTLVWGPGDTTVLPEIILMVEQGKFVWVGQGRCTVSTTHIENLIHGIRLAMEHPCGGEVFFITDQEPVQLRSFLTRYARANGVELPSRSIPAPIVRAGAWLVEGMWTVFRPSSKPPVTRMGAALLSRDYYVTTNKATSLLGYEPLVNIDAGLESLRSHRSPVGGLSGDLDFEIDLRPIRRSTDRLS